MAVKIQLDCFKCQTLLEFVDSIGFREECSKCMADVHVCKNCKFYDATAYNECREPVAEVVLEKERANFCEFFQPREEANAKSTEKDDLLKAAEALFKK